MKLGSNRSHSLRTPKWLKTISIIEIDITADATGGQTVDVPFALTVVGVRAICTVTNAGGTVILSDGTNDISDALTAAVVDTLDQAVSLDQTYVNLKKGATLKLTANGAADRAKVLIDVLPR